MPSGCDKHDTSPLMLYRKREATRATLTSMYTRSKEIPGIENTSHSQTNEAPIYFSRIFLAASWA